jgi:hypothetical protein
MCKAPKPERKSGTGLVVYLKAAWRIGMGNPDHSYADYNKAHRLICTRSLTFGAATLKISGLVRPSAHGNY